MAIKIDRGITPKEVRENLDYDSLSGDFKWRRKSNGWSSVGRAAGSIDKGRYLVIGLKGVKRLAHRLAWAHYYGEFPTSTVDHVNGNGLDNRIANLRLADRRCQSINQRVRNNSMSGVKGVRYNAREGKWLARIGSNGKRTTVGRYATASEAGAAYDAAAKFLFGEFARTNGEANAFTLDDRTLRRLERLRGAGHPIDEGRIPVRVQIHTK
jgi:hypothetical protein